MMDVYVVVDDAGAAANLVSAAVAVDYADC